MRLVSAVCLVTSITLASAGACQESSAGFCYPGLACSTERTQDASGQPLIGARVPDFSFNQNFVIDGVQNLIWSRNLYSIGDTINLFKDAYEGGSSFEQTYADIGKKADAAVIGDFTGWRLANRSEVESLLTTLDATTVFTFFRSRGVEIPARWVLATFDPGAPVTSIPIDGTNYANSSLGRISARDQFGPPNLNPYGLWLVRQLTPEAERTVRPTTEPLRQFAEPIEEQYLSPSNTYTVTRQDAKFKMDESQQLTATVSTTRGDNRRFYARYNLRGIPRGVLATAEVWMSARSWSGAPTPTIQIGLRASPGRPTSPEDLWGFEGDEIVGVWQPLSRARLELPEHIARNAYHVGDDLYLSFVADFNTCEFATPELIIRYVQEQNVLVNRKLP